MQDKIANSKPSLSVKIKRKLGHFIDRLYFGATTDSYDLDNLSKLAAAVASANYVTNQMSGARRFKNSIELIDFVCTLVPKDGLKLEFGVFSGKSINRIAEHFDETIHGFDSFEGLPEYWREGFDKGAFGLKAPPTVMPNVNLVVGWFDKTVEPFSREHAGSIALLHVDCDLYSSTKTIFDILGNRIVAGTMIIFDEYLNYAGWETGEYKAFQEFVEANHLSYKYIAYVPAHQQVAVQVTNAGLG